MILKILQSARERPLIALLAIAAAVTGAVCGVAGYFGVQLFNPFSFRW